MFIFTSGSLLSLKKGQLLKSLDEEHGSEYQDEGSGDQDGYDEKSGDNHLDDEYAAFQVIFKAVIVVRHGYCLKRGNSVKNV